VLGCGCSTDTLEPHLRQWEVTARRILTPPQRIGLAGALGTFSPHAPGRESVSSSLPPELARGWSEGPPPVPDKLSNPAHNYSLLTEAAALGTH
jgi:hypothetical protein